MIFIIFLILKQSIPQFFKKNSSNFKEISIGEFKTVLEKIGVIMFEGK